LEPQERIIYERIRNGDQKAFELVFKKFYANLCAYANQVLYDRDMAEEIVQELFFQIWQKREALMVEASLKSYLYRAVHNSCLNHIKHNKIKTAYQQYAKDQNSNITFGQQEAMEAEEFKVLVRKTIAKLPPGRKKIFMMIRYEQRRYKEVADLLGISVKTVENQMGKAMQFLRTELKSYLIVFTGFIMIALQVFFQIK
jgi:RNA polymerase sigma-70 factor (family 1)